MNNCKNGVVIMMCAVIAACSGGNGDQKTSDDKAVAKAASPDKVTTGTSASAAVGMKFMPVPKLGVQIEVPANAELMETNDTAVMISATAPACTVMLSKIDLDMADSYESSVEQAEKSPMGDVFKAWGKNEKKPDGSFALEWSYKSGLDQKDMWGVNYRVILGDKQAYDCSRNEPDQAAATCVAKACAGLKKL